MRVSGVSYSSDRKLVRCDQQYSYRYDERLKPRVKKKGLYMGSWMHDLEEAYYRWLQTGDRAAISFGVGSIIKPKYKQLKAESWDNLFDEEREMFEEKGFTPKIAYFLMKHYIEHWFPIEKDWEILHVEQSYELPTKFGFPIRWKADLVYKEEGRICLLETKNKEKMPDSNERIAAPQPHAYAFLLNKVGIKVEKIVWNYVRTSPIPRPQVLKRGGLSIRKIQTDKRSYLLSCEEAGLKPNKSFLESLPETLSLMRVTNVANLKLGELFVRDWVDRAKRAREITRPTRNWNRDCKWSCDYTDLCLADMMGKTDRNHEIKKNFVQIKDDRGEPLK
jgi:hypothetical protein